ncbi:MAG: beta strand repeat-containing protein, partial [Runella sp.]
VTNTSNGCKATASTTVTENKTNPTVTLNPINLTCGSTSQTLTATSSPNTGVSYAWTVPSGVTNPGNVASFSVSVAGTYTVEVTNTSNGCKATASTTVTQDKDLPTVSLNNITLTCASSSQTLTATATPSGGVSYVWTVPSGVTNPGNVASFSVSVAGAYTVEVTNTANGCKATATTTVTENKTNPTVMLNSITLTCGSPSQTLTATATPSSGVSYAWTVPSGVTNPGNVASFSVTVPGTYSVEVTNTSNGCKATASTTVTENKTNPTVTLNPINLTCGSTSQTLTATSSPNTGVSYAWTVPSGVTNPGNVASFSVSVAGTYTVEVTNTSNGCKATASTTVTQDKDLPTVSLNNITLTCASSSQTLTATATPSGGVSYVWTVPSGVTNPGNVASFSVSVAGTYTVEVTNTSNGCKATATTTVTENKTNPTVMLNSITLTCGSPSQTLTATATPSSGVSYAWTVPSGVTNPGNVASFSVTVHGTYSVEVTNTSNGCKATASTTVTENKTNPTVTLNSINLTCGSSSQTLTATSIPNTGVSYAWTVPTGVTNPGNVASFSVSVGGTYTVEVTNTSNGCKATATTTVTQDKDLPTVTLNNITLTCATSSQTLTATASPSSGVSYAWTVPSGVTNPGNVASFSVSVAGTYSVEVTNTANGCKATASTTVTESKTNPTVMLNSIILTCGSPSQTLTATANPSGGVSYAWTVPSGVTNPGNVASFSVSVAGAYTVEVTNTANGCKATATTTVAKNDTKPIIEVTERACAIDLKTYNIKFTSDASTVTAAPYTVINNGGGNYSITGIPSGVNVTIIATNAANGCQNTLEVSAPNCSCPTITPPIGTSQTFCEGDTAVALTVIVGAGETADWYATPTGGTPLATGTLTFKTSTAGTYYVESRKTDGSNCTSLRIALTLTINPKPTLSAQLPRCAEDRQTYSVVVSSNGTVTADKGQVANNQNGTFTISGVPAGQDVVVSATSDKTCKNQITVKAPDCACPPPVCVPYTVKKIKVKPTALRPQGENNNGGK